MRAPLFWDATQHILLIIYRRFRTTCRSQPLEPLEPLRCDRQVVPQRRYLTTNLDCATSQKGEYLKKSKTFLLSLQMCHAILYVHHKNITAVILHLPRTTDIFSGLQQCHRYSCCRNSVLGYGWENRGTVVRFWQHYEIFIFLFPRAFRSALGPSGLLIQQEGDLFGDKASDAWS
jgi:hypothetical protein